MSETLYTVQTLVIGVVILLLLRKSSVILQLQVIVWTIGVIALVHRFGITEQLNFYSNDQQFYVYETDNFSLWSIPPDIEWWIRVKVPYVLPASVLAGTGIDPSLALKTVSLICLLLVTRLVLSEVRQTTIQQTLIRVFFTACGGIGMLYSILALRETMMMMLVTYFCISRAPAVRLATLVLLLFLRPHLAAALGLAVLVVLLWEKLRRQKESTRSVALLTLGSLAAGEVLYSVGIWWQFRLNAALGDDWGITVATRIASNFLGLQFLAVPRETVEFSIVSLFLLRVILAETILIPALFTAAVLLRPERVTTQVRLILVTLCLYVSLASNTDFSSFRQNIPLMVVMGMVVVNTWFLRAEAPTINVSQQLKSKAFNSGETSS
jgi:hypothetical protein